MGSVEALSSSGYRGGDSEMEEKKTKKMLSNRESARRSRMRKQEQLVNLTNEVKDLEGVNKKLVECIKTKEEALDETEAANNILKTQAKELTDRLRFLNSIIQEAQGAEDCKGLLSL